MSWSAFVSLSKDYRTWLYEPFSSPILMGNGAPPQLCGTLPSYRTYRLLWRHKCFWFFWTALGQHGSPQTRSRLVWRSSWHQRELCNHICRFLLLHCKKSISFPKRQKTPDVSTGSFHDANSRVSVSESNTWSRWCSTGKMHEHLGLMNSSYMENHFSSMHIAKTLKSEEKCRNCFQDLCTCHF